MDRQIPPDPLDPSIVDPDGTLDTRYTRVSGGPYATSAALTAEATSRLNGDTGLATSVSTETTNRTNADALLAPKASPTFTGTVTLPASTTLTTPTIASFANAPHTHANAAGGGNIPESSVTNLTTDLAAKAPLASPTFTGTVVLPTSQTIVTPTIASFANAAHNHSNAAGGGNIPESSVTNLTSDLALKAPLASPTFTGTVVLPANTVAHTALSGVDTDTATTAIHHTLGLGANQASPGNLHAAIPSGQYFTNLNYGCLGSVTTLVLAANTGYFVPIELFYNSGGFANIALEVTATGTATGIKWAIYPRSASGNATGNPFTGTLSTITVGFAVGSGTLPVLSPTGLPNEYNLCFVTDGTITVRAVTGVKNMYRSSAMLNTVTAGRTAAVTYSTGFVSSPSYTYTDQATTPLAGLKTN